MLASSALIEVNIFVSVALATYVLELYPFEPEMRKAIKFTSTAHRRETMTIGANVRDSYGNEGGT